MAESYEKVGFVDGMPPDLNAHNLNHMDSGIYENREILKKVDNKLEIEHGSNKLNVDYGENGFYISVDGTSLSIGAVEKLVIRTLDSGADPDNIPRIEIDYTGINLYGNVAINGQPI